MSINFSVKLMSIISLIYSISSEVYYLNDAETMEDIDLLMTCSPPTDMGGLGYCGPKVVCEEAVKWSCSKSGKCAVCEYPNGYTQEGYRHDSSHPMDYQKRLNLIASKDCKQSMDKRCTKQALSNLIKGTGIKAAYCNDEFLVIHTDESAGFANHIKDIPNPPGGGFNHDRRDQDPTGVPCQTNMESMYEEYGIYKVRLISNTSIF